MDDLINKLKQKLKEPLPGEDIQYLMAPVNRARVKELNPVAMSYRLSAVILLICRDDKDNLFIPLTERFSYAGAHAGQISLPGGKFDESDLDLVHTAFRECYEEIGLTEGIELTGLLSTLYIPVSNFMVQPVVSFCSIKNVYMVPHEREVKRIIKLYLNDLLDETIVKEGEVESHAGIKIKAPYFEIEGSKVWGATAMILNEFKTVLKSIY